MVNIQTSEQPLRQEAIRRRLPGERRAAICGDLQRSFQWFDKWWAEYRRHPQTDTAFRSRAPLNKPHQTPPEIEQAVLAVRRSLEAADTPETKYGLIGARGKRAANSKGCASAPCPAPPQYNASWLATA